MSSVGKPAELPTVRLNLWVFNPENRQLKHHVWRKMNVNCWKHCIRVLLSVSQQLLLIILTNPWTLSNYLSEEIGCFSDNDSAVGGFNHKIGHRCITGERCYHSTVIYWAKKHISSYQYQLTFPWRLSWGRRIELKFYVRHNTTSKLSSVG